MFAFCGCNFERADEFACFSLMLLVAGERSFSHTICEISEFKLVYKKK